MAVPWHGCVEAALKLEASAFSILHLRFLEEEEEENGKQEKQEQEQEHVVPVVPRDGKGRGERRVDLSGRQGLSAFPPFHRHASKGEREMRKREKDVAKENGAARTNAHQGGATTTPQDHPCTRGNWCCISLVRLQHCCVGGWELYLVQHGDRAISVACRSGTHAVPVSIPGCTPVNARLHSVIRAWHVRACVRVGEMRGEKRKMSTRGCTRGRCDRTTIYAIARAYMHACVQIKGGCVYVCERERE